MSEPSGKATIGPVPLTAVLENQYDDLHRFALRRSGSVALADEVMQDAWLRLAGSTDGRPIDDEAIRRPVAYISRIIANLIIDRQRQSVALGRHEIPQAIPSDATSDGPTPFHVVAGQQEYAILQQAIRELPDRCRQVFLLYRARNMTMRQIAIHLGLSPKTVENHLARAMVHCRQRLREAGRDL